MTANSGPKCPDCKCKIYYDGEVRPSWSGEMYEVKVFKCHKCKCEWDEEELEENDDK